MNCVYTAITGGHAVLHDHPDIPGVDFLCFTDDPEALLDVRHRWQLHPLEEVTAGLSPRRRAKFHKLFPPQEYEWTIWIDGSHRLRMDTQGMVTDMIAASPGGLGLHRHPRLDCIYAEGEDARTLTKCQDQPIMEQLRRYQEAGHPAHWGLWACGSICRNRDPHIADLMHRWWAEILRWSERDQLSLPFVLRTAGRRPDEWPWQLYANPYFAEISHNWEGPMRAG